jgi:glycosyltransferase involved in cell wall biosynthesis
VRILYVASGIPVPGNLGGSTHTYEVARGLAQRGHEVHVVAVTREGRTQLKHLWRPAVLQYDGFTIHHIDIPKIASLLTVLPILRLARALQPDVIIERYYNFAGAGMIAARVLGIPTLLEVNALIIDPPSERKRRLDDRLGGPMRRWATRQCRWADAIVTPLHTTVPAVIDRTRIHEHPWGADVDRFVPADPPHDPALPPTIIFIGSFRAWHGARHGVAAARRVLDAGVACSFVFVGSGPQLAEAQALAAGYPDITFRGALPYADMPAVIQSADIGIAPFDTSAHPALQAAGFYWSPLKIHEYMACGLAVITSAITPLDRMVRHQSEGLLVPEGDVTALADAIITLVADPVTRAQYGAAARARVVAAYSWQQHCADLEAILTTIQAQRTR